MDLLPLEGFSVGVTADRRADEQAELLTRRGAEVLRAPTISTEYLGRDDAVRRATDAVIARPPDYLLATTGTGIRAWFEAAEAWGLGDSLLAALSGARVFARGPKAAGALQVAGLTPAGRAESERVDELVPLIAAEGLAGKVVALQHYGRRDEGLLAALDAHRAVVLEVPVYRYRPPPEDPRLQALLAAVCRREVDAVTFTSAPAVAHLVAAAAVAGCDVELLRAFNDGDVVPACVGPVCAEAANRAGITSPVAPERGRLGLLVRVLTDALQSRRRELCIDGTALVVQRRAVAVGGQTIRLTPSEAAVLDHLLRRPGVVVSKQAILRSLGPGPTSERAVEATVTRLRRRLGGAGTALRAVRGRGYVFDVGAVAQAQRAR